MEKEILSRYNVTLDKNIVDKCKDKMEYTGGKMSPIVNNLLKIWILYPDEINKLLKKAHLSIKHGNN